MERGLKILRSLPKAGKMMNQQKKHKPVLDHGGEQLYQVVTKSDHKHKRRSELKAKLPYTPMLNFQSPAKHTKVTEP